MAWWSALFFARVQAAPFYRQLYADALALLPPGQGRRWLDVGCGPGLLSRLAHEQGYQVTGLDADPHMVARARRLAPQGPRFALGRVESLAQREAAADVVSAASLLAVLPDRAAALRELLGVLKPGGTLLVIEPSARMTPQAVADYLDEHPGLRDAWVLRLWARTRSPQRLVRAEHLQPPAGQLHCHPLLGGLVNAWLLRPAPAPAPAAVAGAGA